MTELHDLLARVTDRIEDPRLEQAALRVARRRRTRRRGVVAAASASIVALAVVLGMPGLDPRGDLRPAAPSSTPAAPSSTPAAPSGTTPPTAAPSSDEKVWPRWDPRDVAQLPAAPDGIAPALPDVIDPPASSPPLTGNPVTAAVLAVEQDGLAQVLGTGGDWRTVPIDGRYPILSLSPKGTHLAVHYYVDSTAAEHDYGVTVHDLTTGSTTQLPAPDGFEPWDNSGWSFRDEDTLLFISGPTAYDVDIDSGTPEATTVPSGMSVTLDPAGNWLSSADFDQPNILTDHAASPPRELSMDATGRLSRIQADEDTVVGTTYDDQRFNVVVADRETLTPQYRLPVHDHDGNYSNWGLGTLAIAEDGTVLLRVALIGRRVDGFRVVAWGPTTGELSTVASSALPVEASVVFARDLLRAVERS